jgi:hypothetical protein
MRTTLSYRSNLLPVNQPVSAPFFGLYQWQGRDSEGFSKQSKDTDVG